MRTADHLARFSQSLNSVLGSQIIFLVTGVITTMCNQLMNYQGAGDPRSLLAVAANYYGMAMANFIELNASSHELPPNTSAPVVAISRRKLLLIAALEVLGSASGYAGIAFAGSGIYQVVYSSVVIFTAILSKFFLSKHLQLTQWLSMLLVTSGLVVSAAPKLSHLRESGSSSMLIGTGFTLAATLMFATQYVLSESLLIAGANPVQMQATIGRYAAILVSAYLLLYTVPNFQQVLLRHVVEQRGNFAVIVLLLIVIMVSGFGHMVTFYRLLGSVGAVSTGILQSLRAVSVFMLSALFFCSSHSIQCLDQYKLLCTVMVVCGILWFSRASRDAEEAKKKEHISDVDVSLMLQMPEARPTESRLKEEL